MPKSVYKRYIALELPDGQPSKDVYIVKVKATVVGCDIIRTDELLHDLRMTVDRQLDAFLSISDGGGA